MAPRSFLRQTVRRLPAQVRVGLVRGDSGFGDPSVQDAAEELGCKFIFVARLTRPVQKPVSYTHLTLPTNREV